MAKIEIEHLYKIFGKNAEKGLALARQGKAKADILEKTGCAVGVSDASLQIEEGEFVVVMGLSGSGKSTLLRCVNRLIEPTAGTVRIDGVDVTSLDDDGLRELRRKHFGMVFQRFALLPHRTVLANTEFGLEIQGMEKAERERKAREALALVGLEGWEASYPGQLSGGMQQRVGLARAMAVDPDILLMDEAFSALDPLIRRDMQEELLSLQSRMHKTILFITHDLDEALHLGDRIVIMKDAQVVQVGDPEEILTSPANAYVERFVEDVNVSKVLTAASVMHKASNVTYPKDGPKAALHTMYEVGISSLLVVDRDRKLLGIVNAEDCARLAEAGKKDLMEILDREVPRVTPDTGLSDLFAQPRFPVAVVNDEGRLVGIVIRGALLAALAEKPHEPGEPPAPQPDERSAS